MPMPIDPSMATGGAEWQIGGVGGLGAPGTQTATPPSETSSDFGGMLANSIQGLEKSQANAAQQSQALATGQAQDPTAVVMAVEQARLSMEFASTMRNKATEAYQEIFRTQV